MNGTEGSKRSDCYLTTADKRGIKEIRGEGDLLY